MAGQRDWNKCSFFATVAVGALAVIAYLRPPDPAHPVKLDFLWTSVSLSMPLWLALLTAVLAVAIVVYIVNRYWRRVSQAVPENSQEIQQRNHEITTLKASIARLEGRKPAPRAAASAAPEIHAANGELILNSPDDIAVKVTPNEWQHLKGYIISVVNHRLGAINRVKFTVYSAQSFDTRHNAYRDGRDFNAFARIEPDPIDASHSGRGLWFVRKDRGLPLLVGDDSDHPLRWPDADPATVQRWRLTIAIDSQTVPMKESDAIVLLRQVKMTLILTWDKEKNEFGIAEEVQAQNDGAAKNAPELAATDPRLSITVIENANNGLFRSGAAITVKNVGGSEVHSLVLQDLIAGTHTISFPGNIGVLNAGDSTPPIHGRVQDYGPLQQHDIANAMLNAWNDLRDTKIEHMSFPATATYTDYQGHQFMASWTYEFLPIKCHVNQLHRDKKEITGEPYDPYLSVSAIKTERLSQS